MRSILIVVCLAFAAIAHADEPAPASPALRLIEGSRLPEIDVLSAKRHFGERLRAAGIVLTILGTVATAAGSAFLVADLGSDTTSTQTAMFDRGTPMIGVGQAAVAAGIALWAGGQRAVSKADRAHFIVSGAGAGVAF